MVDSSWGRASQGGAPRYSYAMHQRSLHMYRHVINEKSGRTRRHSLGGNEPTVRFSDFASAAR